MPHLDCTTRRACCSVGQIPTYLRKILSRVFSFELSSDLSDTYESGRDVVVASGAEVVEGAVDGAGDAFSLFVDDSRDEGVVMIANAKGASTPSPSPSQCGEGYSYSTRSSAWEVI